MLIWYEIHFMLVYKNLFLLLTCIDFIHNKNLSLLQILIIGGWNKYFRYKKYIKYTLQVTNCAAVSNGEIGFCNNTCYENQGDCNSDSDCQDSQLKFIIMWMTKSNICSYKNIYKDLGMNAVYLQSSP